MSGRRSFFASTLVQPALAGVVSLILGLLVHQQGFNFLDDGLWVLGARVLADGGTLYRDLFTVYGPAHYVALLPFFALFGTSALALAVLKAVTDAVAAGVGVALARRLGAGRWAWLVVVAVAALAPVELRLVAAGCFAWIAGEILSRQYSRRRALTLGAFWGGTVWFGLDAFAYATLVLLIAALVARRDQWSWPRVSVSLVSMTGAVGVLVVWGLATSSLGDAFWDLLIYPVTRFRAEMGLPFWHVLLDPAWAQTPFAHVNTGEVLGTVWPGHVASRRLALACLLLLLVLVPAWGLVRAKGQEPLWGALAGFAVAGWMTAGTRGDATHLLGASLGMAWLLPVLLARLDRRLALGLSLLAAMALLPLAGETLWLAANVQRDSLERWQRPTARILMPAERTRQLEATMAASGATPSTPALFWPAQPGMNFIWQIPLATPQATLLGGEVRDPEAMLSALDEVAPAVALLNFRWRLDGRRLRQLCPPAWTWLRSRYRVVSWGSEGTDVVRTLHRVEGAPAAMADVPLQQWLNDREQTVATGMSPDLRTGVRVGQTFPVGDLDLSGIQLRWGTTGRDFQVPVTVFVHRSSPAGEPGKLLGRYSIDVHVESHQAPSLMKFGPVAGTAGKDVAVLITAGAAEHDVRVLWYSAEGDPRWEDRFPAGSALVDGKAVRADLYFLSF